jgi:ferric-dicitrate binding protein FerR (iron transport regulator)
MSQAKVVPLYKKRSVLAIAASVAIILLGSWFFFFRTDDLPKRLEMYCQAGNTKEIVLPDCTLIRLSGVSMLAVNLEEFTEKREVKLEGEGYFSVRKNGYFLVNFSGGTVKVLGTEFDILSDKELSSVKCYEGKVEVGLGAGTYMLEKGNGVRQIKTAISETYNFKEEMPESGLPEIRFEGAPLAEVCSSLSLFYDVSFNAKDIDLNRRFTGMYKKSSLDTALFMVFEPMGIRFEHKSNSVTLKNK